MNKNKENNFIKYDSVKTSFKKVKFYKKKTHLISKNETYIFDGSNRRFMKQNSMNKNENSISLYYIKDRHSDDNMKRDEMIIILKEIEKEISFESNWKKVKVYDLEIDKVFIHRWNNLESYDYIDDKNFNLNWKIYNISLKVNKNNCYYIKKEQI